MCSYPDKGNHPVAILRRLSDAAVVFDTLSWQTHVLPPAAAVVADLIADLRDNGSPDREHICAAIAEDLELDPMSADIQQLLDMFVEIGLIEQ